MVEDTTEEDEAVAPAAPAPPVEELVIEDVTEPSPTAHASSANEAAEIATFTRSGH